MLRSPVLAKHSKSFSLVDAISVGVDRMQRNFEPMRRQVETWRAQQLTSATAKLIIYRAFIEDELDAPKHLARRVHKCTLRRNTKTSNRVPCGVCRMPLPPHSRNWSPFPSSR